SIRCGGARTGVSLRLRRNCGAAVTPPASLRAAGVPSYLIDDDGEIDPAWLEGIDTAGVTSGASAPERLVTRVCDWFRDRGVADISPFSSVYEDVVFRLPVELRRAETPAA
ncbi:MAG TPA: hypothetical protein VE736_09630, partial [Gaiellaceae bacterium]|nr:hypothetical protein [Gaiellaceae bacterium]